MNNMATISLPMNLLIIISLALTISSITSASTSACPGFDSVPELLKNYSLPAGLFPANVASFECSPIEETNKLRLSLTINISCTGSWGYLGETCCRVTTTNFTAVYERTISATIFENNLTDLKGFLAKFSDEQPLAPVTDVLAFFNVAFQLKTKIGFSPPVYFFENYKNPPICDPNSFYARPLLVV